MVRYTLITDKVYTTGGEVKLNAYLSLSIPLFSQFVIQAINTIASYHNIKLDSVYNLSLVFKMGSKDPDIPFEFQGTNRSTMAFIRATSSVEKEALGDGSVSGEIGNTIGEIRDPSFPTKVSRAIAKLTILLYIKLAKSIIFKELKGPVRDIESGDAEPEEFADYEEYHLRQWEKGVYYTFEVDSMDDKILTWYGILGDIYVNYVETLPDKIIKSIMEYTYKHYSDINAYLRYEELDGEYDDEWLLEIKRDISNIDKAFKKAPPLQEVMTVYRGQAEMIFDAKSYTSTSLELSVALKHEFTDMENACCLYIITVVPGSKVLPLEPISQVEGEYEVLLDRNGKFFITDVKVETHTVDDDEYPPIRTIYLTYMPPESHVVMPEDRWANYEDQEEEGEEDYTDEPNEGEEEYYTDEPDEEGDY
jgi:hypothetical protein